MSARDLLRADQGSVKPKPAAPEATTRPSVVEPDNPHRYLSVVASIVACASCSSAPPLHTSTAPTLLVAPEAGALHLVEAEPEAEATCPVVSEPACDSYLRIAAECFDRAAPESRATLRRRRARLCDVLRGDPASAPKPRVTCTAALRDLMDEPACAPQAATAAFGHLLGLPPPRCGAQPRHPIDPDPEGLLRIVVRSELPTPSPIRAVVVAVDGVPIMVRSLSRDAKTEGSSGPLDTFQGRVATGEYWLQLLTIPRADPDDAVLGSVKIEGRCVTLFHNEAQTATFSLYDPKGKMGPFVPFATRFELR